MSDQLWECKLDRLPEVSSNTKILSLGLKMEYTGSSKYFPMEFLVKILEQS